MAYYYTSHQSQHNFISHTQWLTQKQFLPFIFKYVFISLRRASQFSSQNTISFVLNCIKRYTFMLNLKYRVFPKCVNLPWQWQNWCEIVCKQFLILIYACTISMAILVHLQTSSNILCEKEINSITPHKRMILWERLHISIVSRNTLYTTCK